MLFRSSTSPIGSRPGYATIDVPFDVVCTASSGDTSRADVRSLLANSGLSALDPPHARVGLGAGNAGCESP
jgi:hypothetical protein